ncbi:MAG: hypothetical protein JWM59_2374 [Verrucomicrobiales bacterium]|nr:hypothetical protein [Verrucomicrobiales bacterium]
MHPRSNVLPVSDSLLESDPWRYARRVVGITTAVAVMIQLCLSADILMFECLGLCIVGTFLFAWQFQRDKFRKGPFSMLMLLGFGSTYFYLPLIFTTFEFSPVYNKLVVPVEDFTAALAVYVCLILMQRLCAGFSPILSLRRGISSKVLKPLGFFSTPSELQLWGMGMVGVIGFLVGHSSTHEADSETLEKFFQSFRIFTFAPFLLLVPQMIGGTNKIKKSATALIIFTVVLFCLAMSTGSRGYTVVGLVTAVCSYWLGVWSGVIRANRFKFRHLLLVSIGLYLITGPLGDAFTAANAGSTGKGRDRSIGEAFSDFVEAFSSEEILENYKNVSAKVAAQEGAWIETYVENEFLRRFANLSFMDNTFSIALSIDDNSRDKLRKIETLRAWSILPNPVIQFFGIEVDKKEDFKGSMGDIFYNETLGQDAGLGSYKTGNLISSAYNLFGLAFPVMIALLAGGLFIQMDCLVIGGGAQPGDVNDREEGLKFSPLGLLQSYAIFSILSSTTSVESYSGLLSVLARNYLQWIILYLIIFWATSFIFGVRKASSKSGVLPVARGPMGV